MIEGSHILVAAGRVPNTAGIGLEEAGIELDARGYIRVNERLETTAPDVWAIGECAGSPQFTHVSVDDFRIFRDNLAGGNRSTRGGWFLTACLPTRRSRTSDSAKAKHDGESRRARRTLPMSSVLRTAATDETQGFMKAIVGARRPHSRLHHDRCRGGRSDGRRADGDVGGPALREAAGRRPCPSDDG